MENIKSISTESINEMIAYMSDNYENDIALIKEEFESLEYKDSDNQSILHILTSNKYDEYKLDMTVMAILNDESNSINLNLKNSLGQNFVQTALYTGYSEMFINTLVSEGCTKKQNKLDINHVDNEGNTIMHTLIDSKNYSSLINLYEIFCEFGFDSTIKNNKGLDILEFALSKKEQFSMEELREFKEKFLEEIRENDELLGKHLKELQQFGTILNIKKFISAPVIAREKELESIKIGLCREKSGVLIVGESGIGKTMLVEGLTYQIKKGDVPKFLRNRIILEISPQDLIAGKGIVGSFEDTMKNLVNVCKKYNVILFIDAMETIYGTGSYKNNDNDMAKMLKRTMDRLPNLKVIGTINSEEYGKYFTNSDLKDKFEPIYVKEPSENDLYVILDKIIDDYCKKNMVKFEKKEYKAEVVDIIVKLTDRKSRKYDDIVNNPNLSISIIDTAFAYAKYYDSKHIKIEYFIEAIESCNRIYDYSKQIAVSRLKEIDNITYPHKTRVIRLY